MTCWSVGIVAHGISLEPICASSVGSLAVNISMNSGSGIRISPTATHRMIHVVARNDDRVVDHVGWARREIGLGTDIVAIAGVAGMLISDEARGQRLGVDLMGRARRSMRDHGGVAFGYRGCREQVVPFYASCGWTRIVVDRE